MNALPTTPATTDTTRAPDVPPTSASTVHRVLNSREFQLGMVALFATGVVVALSFYTPEEGGSAAGAGAGVPVAAGQVGE
ncbi:hypothetical protein BH23VER1_BH23VER1_34850 [soil metagenome]